jgi:hypothetical protein
MATRTVQTTLLRPNGTAWSGGVVEFQLDPGSYTATTTYPCAIVSATADANGLVSVALWVEESEGLSAARYRCRLPSNEVFTFDLASGVGAAELSALRTAATDPVPETTAQAIIDAHAAVIASAEALGHVRVGTGLAIDGDGVLSATGGLSDGDKGAITVSSSGAAWSIDAGAVSTTELGGDITTAGKALLADASATAQRATLGLGTLATLNATARPLLIPFRAQYQNTTWNAMPAALTNFLGGTTPGIKVDLTNYTEARLVVRQASAGAASAELRMQYSTDESTWAYLDGATGPSVEAATANTSKVSGWVTLEAGARADVWLRLAGINGDGVANPSFQNISLHVR